MQQCSPKSAAAIATYEATNSNSVQLRAAIEITSLIYWLSSLFAQWELTRLISGKNFSLQFSAKKTPTPSQFRCVRSCSRSGPFFCLR